VIAALFTVAELWGQPGCLSTSERVEKMWYVYTVECCSAIKRKETMSFAGGWVEQGIVLLGEIS
jgi:hypothetical protein